MNDFGLIITEKICNKRKIYFVFNNKCFHIKFFINKYRTPKPDVKIYNFSEFYNFHMENNTFHVDYLVGVFKNKHVK